jgi:diguanylate cyclase (GGDEF)-like protein
MSEVLEHPLLRKPGPFTLGIIGPLPVVSVLCAAEAQRHWHQPGMWAFMAATTLIAVNWLALIARKPWAASYRNGVVDAAILLLIASAIISAVRGNKTAATTLSNTLLFWAPLVCLWLGSSQRRRPALTLFLFLAMYGQSLAVDSTRPDMLRFEQMLLGAVILVATRQFVRERPAQVATTILQDRVTGLISAECFETELAMIASVAGRYRIPFALIACAPDRRSPGAKEGMAPVSEDLLKSLAGLIVDRIRQSDTLCRWEGGTFFVLLPNTSKPDAIAVASGLHAALRDAEPSSAPPVTCSFGVAIHQFGEDPMQTFSMTEQALQDAIQAGGNRIAVAEANQ